VGIVSNTGDTDEFNLAKAAFIEAHDRFQAAHIQNDVGVWYASLSETLWWVFALDDYYRSHYSAKYMEFRDRSAYGSVIAGLKHARNSVGHSLALLVDYSYAIDKKPGTVSLKQLHWRTLNDTNPPYQGNKQAYQSQLAGKAVRYSLRRANQFFIRQKDELNKRMTE